MENVFVAATANRRFYLRLVLVLAASGLGLALLGIYGVIAYFVTQRTPEIGLRLAVGAGKADVVRMVIGQALRLVLIGIAHRCTGSADADGCHEDAAIRGRAD